MCKSTTCNRDQHPETPSVVFVRTRNYDALAGVLLSLTGCEAVL